MISRKTVEPVIGAVPIGVVTVVALVALTRFNSRLPMDDPDLELFRRIKQASTVEERERLITQLENTPVGFHPFHHRWICINEHPLSGWSDSGYDPSLCKLPRDIQLLAAAEYSRNDILNGGFYQFFTNSTGVLAPEVVEWFDRAGFHEAAGAIRDAMALFGDEYPRSQEARGAFLAKFPGETRQEWDPFPEMDLRFDKAVSDEAFDAAADHWIRGVCGVQSLHDTVDDVRRRQAGGGGPP